MGPLHCLLSIFSPLHCLDWVVHVLDRTWAATWPHCAGHGVQSVHWPHVPRVSGLVSKNQHVQLGFHGVQTSGSVTIVHFDHSQNQTGLEILEPIVYR